MDLTYRTLQKENTKRFKSFNRETQSELRNLGYFNRGMKMVVKSHVILNEYDKNLDSEVKYTRELEAMRLPVYQHIEMIHENMHAKELKSILKYLHGRQNRISIIDTFIRNVWMSKEAAGEDLSLRMEGINTVIRRAYAMEKDISEAYNLIHQIQYRIAEEEYQAKLASQSESLQELQELPLAS